MAKDPAFLFYPGDYLRDTQCLSEKTQVAYDRIMCEHMRNICISKQQLKFFTKRLNPDEIEELMMTLTKKDDGYQIAWVAESIEKRRAYSESRRKNRIKKEEIISETYDEHMEDEIEDEIDNKDEYSFIDFWNLYDKKVGSKKKLVKKWEKLSENDRQLIMEYIPKYKKAQPNKQYRKNPETFLNNESWLDEIIEPDNKNGFPNKFDIDFQNKLSDGKELSAYWEHLRKIGLKPVKNKFGVTVDWK